MVLFSEPGGTAALSANSSLKKGPESTKAKTLTGRSPSHHLPWAPSHTALWTSSSARPRESWKKRKDWRKGTELHNVVTAVYRIHGLTSQQPPDFPLNSHPAFAWG